MHHQATSGQKKSCLLSPTVLSLGMMVLAAGSFNAKSAEAAPRYKLIDMGPFSPPFNSTISSNATSINNSNQVIGTSDSQSVYFAPGDNSSTVGEMQYRSNFGNAIDLNNSGAFLYQASSSTSDSTARLGLPSWQSYILPQPLGLNSYLPRGLNDNYDIVGTARDTSNNPVPILTKWDYQTRTLISTQKIVPFPSGLGYAYDINNNGTVVGAGASDLIDSDNARIWRAFTWKDDVTTSLPPLSGYIQSSASEINDLGQTAGTSSKSGLTTACTWINGEPVAITPPIPPALSNQAPWSQSTSINSQGQIVGIYLAGSFLWENGEAIPLDDRIDTPGYELSSVNDINDNGIIAGAAIVKGTWQNHAVLLVPIVAPPDTTPPVTTATPTGQPGNAGWYVGTQILVKLSATDDRSGAPAIYYKLDSGAAIAYANEFQVEGSGTHNLEFWSVDIAGNTELHQTLALRIDTSAPSLTWGQSTPAANTSGWNRTPVERTYVVADNAAGSGIGTVVPASPLGFALEGANQTQSVTATDVAGNSAVFVSPAVNLDFTSPVSSAQPSGTAGNAGFYVGTVQITLTASDNLSGVENTFYKIDNGTTQTFASPFSISGDGSHSVVFWSGDRAGNVENSKTLAFSVDTTAPVSSHALTGPLGDNGWYKGSVQVTLNATDANGSGLATTNYRIDGGAAQTYSQPFTVLGDAVHTVTYSSTDVAGNQEQPSRSVTIKIDGMAPVIAWGGVSPAPNALGWNNAAADISFTASDNLSGVSSVVPASPLRFNLEGANQTQSVTATDVAGNSAVFTSALVNIDTIAPVSAAVFTGTAGSNGWYISNVQCALSPSDTGGSGVQSTSFKLDGGATQNYSAPFAITQDGMRAVNFWSSDKAGNVEVSKSATVKIDKVAPLITAVANPTSLASVKTFKPVVISGKITDAASGFNPGSASYSTVDEYGTVKPAGTITVQADGTYSFTVSLEAKRNNSDKDGRAYTITIRAADRAGLQTAQTVVVLVL